MKIQRNKNTGRSLLSSSCPNISSTNYNDENQAKKLFFIGVSGGSASGKTTVCEEIANRLNDQRVQILSLDSFYKPLSHDELENVKSYNFDAPDAFDWELLAKTLKKLSKCKTVNIPLYDFTTHSRCESTTVVHGAISDVIVLEGILVFHNAKVLELLDLKIFVDTDSDTRLARRVVRDMNYRGRTLESILHQYETFVKPSFDNFILPTKKFADIVIPRGGSNEVAIDLIEQAIRTKLEERNFERNKREKNLPF